MSITNGPKSFCIKSMQILKTKIEAYRKHTIFHMFLIARIKLEFKNFLSCPLLVIIVPLCKTSIRVAKLDQAFMYKISYFSFI